MPGDEWGLRPTKAPRRPVAAIAMGTYQVPVVICDDGTAWAWGVPASVIIALPEHERFAAQTSRAAYDALPHEWVQFHQPIPGTQAHAEYMEER